MLQNYYKLFIRGIFYNFRNFFDFLLSFLVRPPALLLRFYRRIGSARLPRTTAVLMRLGVFPIRDHYYEPLFSDKLLTIPLECDRELPGIALNDSDQLRLLTRLSFKEELLSYSFGIKPSDDKTFHFNNGSFESGDAEFLYQFIRHLKPKKVIEIGSGNSTKLVHLALQKNKFESGIGFLHICIEPYEHPWLDQLENVTVLRELVENCNIDWSKELNSGDLLFVDSSHVIRPQGDVLKEYLEIFPVLQAGVYVHVHDIFTPKNYLRSWLIDDVRFWNEQYLLEVLLSNSQRYKIVAAINYLKHHYYNNLLEVCPYLTKSREPGSFYFKIVD